MAASQKLILRSDSGVPTWTVPGKDKLVWLGWDGFYMVFHPASGEMHLLDSLAREIVDVIAEKPCTQKDLLQEMEKIFGRTFEAEFSEKIMGSLAELDKIGLVEPVDSAAASL